MPILIRIIVQRLLVGIFSVLAFFGINPDVSVPTPEHLAEVRHEQDRLIEVILQPAQESASTSTPKAQNPIIKFFISKLPQKTTDTATTISSPAKESVKEVEQKITELQKEFTQTITEPVKEKIVEKVVPEALVSKEPAAFDVRNVVVNIMCLEKTKTYTKMSSGSGVIITSSGIVLTNAHVAYPFLLGSQLGYGTYTCTIRQENIPYYGYNAELVYYPVDWLNYNSEIIKEAAPVGTGENDYALLAITTPTGPAPKSSVFSAPSLAVAFDDLQKGEAVTIAGYPSTNSGVFELDTNPGLKIAQTKIDDFFTFSNRSFDVLQTDVNSVARRGSSGGGVFRSNFLTGIVVTTNQRGDGSYINALTIPYIKRDFRNDTGTELDTFIGYSLDILRARFATQKEQLREIISESLSD